MMRPSGPERNLPMREPNARCLEIIQSFEGLEDGDPTTVNLDPYLDPVGIWTIGWGHAIVYGGKLLRGAENKGLARSLYPLGITREQAQALLKADALEKARDVQALVLVPLTDNQLSALVSFAFNVGIGALASSTLLRLLNAGDYASVPAQMARWVKGQVRGKTVTLPGLVERRRLEGLLWEEKR